MSFIERTQKAPDRSYQTRLSIPQSLESESRSTPTRVNKNHEHTSFRILAGWDERTRHRAENFVRKIYGQSGLGNVSGDSELKSLPTESPSKFTLLAEAPDTTASEPHLFNQQIFASVSLIFDGGTPLPCETIFASEMMDLRAQRREVCEVTGLAVQGPAKRSRTALVRLFNLLYLYAYHVRFYDDFVVEVNPHHMAFYKRLFGFELLGSQRPCPRVAHAPAVLLRLNLSEFQKRLHSLRAAYHATRETWISRGYCSYLLDSNEARKAIRAMQKQEELIPAPGDK